MYCEKKTIQEDLDNFTKDQLQKWLKSHGLGVSGTRDELLTRIKKFIRYPKLTQRLYARHNNKHVFKTSLDPLVIPPVNAH